MTYRPAIHSQSDLHDAWQRLLGPLGFSGHSTWLMLIDADDRAVPHLARIDDDGGLPGPREQEGLVEVLRMVADELVPDGRVAFLRSRPGGGGITRDDRIWARFLHGAARAAGTPVEVVHRASDVDLVPVPMDELLAESA